MQPSKKKRKKRPQDVISELEEIQPGPPRSGKRTIADLSEVKSGRVISCKGGVRMLVLTTPEDDEDSSGDLFKSLFRQFYRCIDVARPRKFIFEYSASLARKIVSVERPTKDDWEIVISSGAFDAGSLARIRREADKRDNSFKESIVVYRKR